MEAVHSLLAPAMDALSKRMDERINALAAQQIAQQQLMLKQAQAQSAAFHDMMMNRSEGSVML